MKRIGVDVDGVIADIGTSLEIILSRHLNKEIKKEDIIDYSLSEYNVTDENITNLLDYDFYMTMGLEPNARESLEKLKEKDYQIYLITARDKFIKEQDTRRWLQRKGIPYDKLIQVVRPSEKIAVVQSHVLRTLIDDNFDTCSEFSKRRMRTILFEQPWNFYHCRTTKREYKYMELAKDWNQIVRDINKWTEELI